MMSWVLLVNPRQLATAHVSIKSGVIACCGKSSEKVPLLRLSSMACVSLFWHKTCQKVAMKLIRNVISEFHGTLLFQCCRIQNHNIG